MENFTLFLSRPLFFIFHVLLFISIMISHITKFFTFLFQFATNEKYKIFEEHKKPLLNGTYIISNMDNIDLTYKKLNSAEKLSSTGTYTISNNINENSYEEKEYNSALSNATFIISRSYINEDENNDISSNKLTSTGTYTISNNINEDGNDNISSNNLTSTGTYTISDNINEDPYEEKECNGAISNGTLNISRSNINNTDDKDMTYEKLNSADNLSSTGTYTISNEEKDDKKPSQDNSCQIPLCDWKWKSFIPEFKEIGCDVDEIDPTNPAYIHNWKFVFKYLNTHTIKIVPTSYDPTLDFPESLESHEQVRILLFKQLNIRLIGNLVITVLWYALFNRRHLKSENISRHI